MHGALNMNAAKNWTPWGNVPPTRPVVGNIQFGSAKAYAKPSTNPQARAIPHAANDNHPRVIALTGLAGSGKSTAADYLVADYGYTLVKFAGPLKAMLREVGLTVNEIEGNRKELPIDFLCGKTPRQAMQTLGYEWGRKCIGEDFWVNAWRLAVNDCRHVVVDDCRFPNEAMAVRRLGGEVWRITGRGGIAGDHESESGCGYAEVVIDNSGERGALIEAVDGALRRYAA